MRNFLIHAIVSAIAILITAWLLPGITIVEGVVPLLIVGILFGIVNGLIRPLLMFLSCPFIILSFGLFAFVVNGLLLQVVAWLAGDWFRIDGLGWAILGGIVMGIVSMIIESLFNVDRRSNGNGSVDVKVKR